MMSLYPACMQKMQVWLPVNYTVKQSTVDLLQVHRVVMQYKAVLGRSQIVTPVAAILRTVCMYVYFNRVVNISQKGLTNLISLEVEFQ